MEGDVMESSPNDITQLLLAWSDGDKAALDKLMPVVYQELHRLAHNHLTGEREGHTLQTTALVNEAYVKLIDQKRVRWQSRSHFFAVASKIMRRILVDYARSRKCAKRGGGLPTIGLDEGIVVSPERSEEIIAVDEALTALAGTDERKARIVELRFFVGLSIEETAALLEVSPGTVMKDWTFAKAWLQRKLNKINSDER
jgi:RNA polymerase sigma factor (TIGR02999 family)